VLSILENIKMSSIVHKLVALADLIVLGGNAGIEKAMQMLVNL
jgi:catalase (peroxidase I)